MSSLSVVMSVSRSRWSLLSPICERACFEKVWSGSLYYWLVRQVVWFLVIVGSARLQMWRLWLWLVLMGFGNLKLWVSWLRLLVVYENLRFRLFCTVTYLLGLSWIWTLLYGGLIRFFYLSLRRLRSTECFLIWLWIFCFDLFSLWFEWSLWVDWVRLLWFNLYF